MWDLKLQRKLVNVPRLLTLSENGFPGRYSFKLPSIENTKFHVNNDLNSIDFKTSL